MIWIFALGIIFLAVVNEGFRKLVFWLLGIGTSIVALMLIHLAFS